MCVGVGVGVAGGGGNLVIITGIEIVLVMFVSDNIFGRF